MTNTISKRELKAKMSEIFRQLEESSEELIVTDHGKPVLKIIPIKEEKKATVSELFGDFQGKAICLDDINTPTLSAWTDC